MGVGVGVGVVELGCAGGPSGWRRGARSRAVAGGGGADGVAERRNLGNPWEGDRETGVNARI